MVLFSERYIPYDDTGQRAYENACKKYKALTSTSFHRKLAESTNIDLRHYGAGPRGGKALAIPLVVSSIMLHNLLTSQSPEVWLIHTQWKRDREMYREWDPEQCVIICCTEMFTLV